MVLHQPSSVYTKNYQHYQTLLAQLHQRKRWLGWGRLLVVVGTGLLVYQLYPMLSLQVIAVGLLGIGVFLALVAYDVKNNQRIDANKRLLHINEEELKILGHQFHHRPDGRAFAPTQHHYANDLDLFGTASLYQFINRCHTEQGCQLLADNLLAAIPTTHILDRQAAIAELSMATDWQQRFQMLAQQSTITVATQKRITAWITDTSQPFESGYWQWVLWVYAAFTLGVVGLNLADVLSTALLSIILACCLLFSFYQSKKVQEIYQHLSKMATEISVLEKLLKHIETASFTAAPLKAWQQVLSQNGQASIQINTLKKILQRFDARLNVYLFLLLNTLFLWDVWQTRALNKWKQSNSHQLNAWFALLAEAEVTNTLSILAFNQPSWCLPSISSEYFHFQATALGHPLIHPDKRIDNSFTLDGTGQVVLITGSNMAGKSTFLRSLGVNMVLALMGSKVCATAFTVCNSQLLSSMRVADNLAESTSTFYAELKKLKSIIQLVKERKQVFILLDEILRGTNSLERHTGSRALIKQLIAQQSVAILATHDVALAEEAAHHTGHIANYHFDAQVQNEELFFDYQIKHGVCTNLNATILMRKIGLEID